MCGVHHHWTERIWPFCDLFGIFPYDVILAEDEQRAVDGEAALFDRYGVVKGHGPCSLSHSLLVHPWAPRRRPTRLPACPSGRARRTAHSVAGGQFVFKASHSWIAQMLLLLEKPKLTPERKWRRSITTYTVVPSPLAVLKIAACQARQVTAWGPTPVGGAQVLTNNLIIFRIMMVMNLGWRGPLQIVA